MSRKNKNRGRKDHYVPQGYLRGFIDPARSDCDQPLWVLDLASNTWSEKSSKEVMWERGFYDYSGDATGLEHPDVTFAQLEREFPIIRERIIDRNFKKWTDHKYFLLSFMQMVRARSPLFLQQQEEQNRKLRGVTITEVGPGNQIKVDSLEPRPLPEAFIRNRTISQMGDEIKKGPDWMENFHWCLRYSTSPSDPFITSQYPLLVQGSASDIVTGIQHPDTHVFFPICWQACLIGSLIRFDVGTEQAEPSLLAKVRWLCKQLAGGYVISPRLDDEKLADAI
jgi:hypothetical protein